jgi:hypothetical protein
VAARVARSPAMNARHADTRSPGIRSIMFQRSPTFHQVHHELQ